MKKNEDNFIIDYISNIKVKALPEEYRGSSSIF